MRSWHLPTAATGAVRPVVAESLGSRNSAGVSKGSGAALRLKRARVWRPTLVDVTAFGVLGVSPPAVPRWLD